MGEVGVADASEKRAPFADWFAFGSIGRFALAFAPGVGSAGLRIVPEVRLDGPVAVALLPSEPPNVFRGRRVVFDGGMLATIVDYAWVDYTGGCGAAFNPERESL